MMRAVSPWSSTSRMRSLRSLSATWRHTGRTASSRQRAAGTSGSRRTERRPLSLARAAGLDGAAVHLHQAFADGQAQAQAAELAGDVRAALLKGVEDVGQQLRLDAFAAVVDLDDDLAVARRGGSGCPRSRRAG